MVGSAATISGQRLEHRLDVLARTQEAEAQDDAAAGESERRLARLGRGARQVRDAVRDDLHPERVDRVRLNEQLGRCPGQDDGRRHGLRERDDDLPLAGRRVGRERVERHDRGDREGVHEIEDRLAVVSAPDAGIELDRNDVRAALHRAADARVVVALIAPDLVVDLHAVSIEALERVQARRSRDPG